MSRDYPLSEILLPMGGTTVKDLNKMDEIWESDQYVAEEKIDGSRYLSVGGRFFSRRLSVVDKLPVEKTDNVPHLAEILRGFPMLLLDGEIYIEGGKSNEVVSIMGAKPEKAVSRQEERGKLGYTVFDILRDIDGNWLIDLPWIDRRNILEEQLEIVFETFPHAEVYINIPDYVTENKKKFYRDIVNRGGEGVMLKHVNGKYTPDKKPRWNWIKVKSEITSDVVITGFKAAKREYEGKELDTWVYWESEEGRKYILLGEESADELSRELGMSIEPITKFYYMGWVGAVEFAQYDDKGVLKQVGFCSGLTEEMRRDMSENPDKYVGECMEISAMERTKDGYFRHPQFLRMRPDKIQKIAC